MRVRLSPRTTAPLHLGNARLALLGWLLARRAGGRVVLQLRDAEERTTPEQIEALTADLAWLGLDWDATLHQSAQAGSYAAAIERLKAARLIYPCFEGEEELNSKRDQRQRRNQPIIYDRAMLRLTPEQRAAAEAGGKRPYWRFLLPATPVEWADTVLGRQSVKLSATSDPILVRADGTPSALLADVVDDLDLGTTDLVAGEDHLTASAIQLLLRGCLGARPGTLRLAHVPLLLAADGQRLKRTAALSLRTLRADGVEPAALATLLATLGTSRTAAAEPPAPAPALARRFDPARFRGGKAPRFQPRDLLALNHQALATLPFEAVQDRLPPAATAAFWLAVRGGLDLLREARGWWDVVSGTIVPPLLDGEAPFFKAALAELPPEPWDEQTWTRWTAALATASGRGGEALVEPLRLALTGEDHGPDLAPLLPLMGRSRVAERLRLATN